MHRCSAGSTMRTRIREGGSDGCGAFLPRSNQYLFYGVLHCIGYRAFLLEGKMTDFMDDPFEPHEIDHEYLHLPEDCEHENIDRRMDKDGGFYTVCLDCGEEW